MELSFARYREYVPCAALRPHVRALFSFRSPAIDDRPTRTISRELLRNALDPAWSGLFAEAHGSIVFLSSAGYQVNGVWEPTRPTAHFIGPMSAGRTAASGDRLEMFGVYFRPMQLRRMSGVPGRELQDQIVALDNLWGAGANLLEEELRELAHDDQRIHLLEAALLRRIGIEPRMSIDLEGIANLTLQAGGRVRIESLAHSAGVSRQYLTRIFREEAGVSPKLYCRLARFHTGLLRTSNPRIDWADAAADLGYADQSHMIAEFREFSGFTPAALAAQRTFHPFIEPGQDPKSSGKTA